MTTLAFGELFFTEEVYNFWYINHGDIDCNARLSILTHMPLTAVWKLTDFFSSQLPNHIIFENHLNELENYAKTADLAILNQRQENKEFAKSAKINRYKGIRSTFGNK